MTKERAIEVKAKMREQGMKHYIYGGLFLTVHGLRKDEFECGHCCFTDEELERETNRLYRYGYETVYAIHA